MAMSLTSPVTGGTQTGFTAPTYTLTADTAPDQFGKQWAVTALGGTQAGVTVHSASNPFTVTINRPKQMKSLPSGNLTNSVIRNVPNNTWKLVFRKGLTPASGQPVTVRPATIEIPVPAGADTNDAANLRALISLMVGTLNQISAGLGDSTVTGIV